MFFPTSARTGDVLDDLVLFGHIAVGVSNVLLCAFEDRFHLAVTRRELAVGTVEYVRHAGTTGST